MDAGGSRSEGTTQRAAAGGGLTAFGSADELVRALADEPVGLGGSGVRALAHDLDREVAVLRLLLDRVAVGGPRADLDGVHRQVAVLQRVLDGALCRAGLSRVDLGALAHDVVRAATVRHAGRIELVVSGTPVVHGEPGLLRRAIANLVDNACTAAARGTVLVVVDGSAQRTLVCVEDDGSSSSAVRGQGLGLVVVNAVARMQGGALTRGLGDLGGWAQQLVLPADGPGS